MNARSRPGWTLVELLVVVAIIGALVALTLPAIQSAREAARSVHCRNNLRQIAVATLQHVDAYGAFPPARLQPHPADPASSCSGGQPSWLVRVLAYLDRQASFSRWRIYDSFADHDEQLRLEIVPVLVCPTRRDVASAAMRTPFRLEWVEPTAPEAHLLCPICDSPPWPGKPGPVPSPEPAPDPPPGDDAPDPVGPAPPRTYRYAAGALGDYAGNHGDPSPGFAGLETDFHHGGNGVGLIISSRPACSAAGRPVDWLDRIAPRSIPDGLSHTLLAGERHVAQEQIGLPPYDGPMFDGSHLPSIAALAGPGFPISPGPTHRADTPYTFGSWHPQHCHMALADGSVHAVANDIDPLLLARLANRQDER